MVRVDQMYWNLASAKSLRQQIESLTFDLRLHSGDGGVLLPRQWYAASVLDVARVLGNWLTTSWVEARRAVEGGRQAV